MELSALILAGGRSRRMGRPKAFLHHEGLTLLQHAARTLGQLDPVELLISGRPGEDYGCVPEARVLLDREPDLGPLGGIERGLACARTPLLLVLAVDLPHMTVAFLRRLIGACAPATGVVPRLDGRIEPLAALYPVRAHPLADQLLRHRQLSVRTFAQTCLAHATVRVLSTESHDARCFHNWNTPADASQPTAPEVNQPSSHACSILQSNPGDHRPPSPRMARRSTDEPRRLLVQVVG